MASREFVKNIMDILVAYGEGKDIQWRRKGSDDSWESNAGEDRGLGFYDSYEYRVKPEPKVYTSWVNSYFDKEAKTLCFYQCYCSSEEIARAQQCKSPNLVYLGPVKLEYTEDVE